MKKHASTSDDNIVLKLCAGTDFVKIENISPLGRSATQGEAEDESDRSAGEEKTNGGGKGGCHLGEIMLLRLLLYICRGIN